MSTLIARRCRSLKQRQAIDTTAGEKKTPVNSASAVLMKGSKLTNSNVTCTRVEIEPLPWWVHDVLHEMNEGPVEITRTHAKDLCREIFGPPALRDLPPGKGRKIFRLPNSYDALILDYDKRAPLFEPSWVTGRVHRDALRTVLRPGLRLELFLSDWLGPILRLLRIGGRGGSAAIWARGIAQ
jgi:hypothetical protein